MDEIEPLHTNTPEWDSQGAGSGLKLEGDVNILVVRSDRLGDVILSTPVFEVIKRNYKKSQVVALVRENVLPILQGLSSVDQFLVFDPEGRHSGVRGFFLLCREIRKFKFKIAILLQSHWKIAAAVFFSGVRYRVGPLSKLYSYLFYNRGLRQRRSQVEMHESDYNLQLLRKIGIRVGARTVPTQIIVHETMLRTAQDWLKKSGWDSYQKLIVVHPGMGGSALNWPESHYIELIQALIETGHQILITGGSTEVQLLERVRKDLGALAEKIIFYQAEPKSSVDFLAGLFNYAQLVVAPSTGPLHLAVALNKPVLTFYPPIRVQSALRWGPYLPDEARASVLVPEVYCGQDFNCLGSLCNYFPCMKSLTVKQALEEIHRQLASSKGN
jgi:ADP-heptose:LPS heptosyltransferase